MKSIVLLPLLSTMALAAYGQGPVKTSPQYYKVLLENDQVRVLEYRLKPGEKEPIHSHPAGIVYVLSGAKLRFSYPAGRTEERAAATGEAIWRDPVTHAVENVGETEAHAIAVDLKTSGQQQKDEQQVGAIVQSFYRAFNSHGWKDAAGFSTEDWNHINPLGGWTLGRAAVLKELEEVHATFLKGVSDKIEDMVVRFATPNAAVVTVTSRMSTFTTPDGIRHENEQHIKTFVVVKRDGGWLIMQDQNTAVARLKT